MGTTKELVKQTVGTVLLPFMRQRVEDLAQNEFSMTVGPRSFVNSCLRAALARKLLRQNQVDVMSYYHQQFWTGERGTEFHRHVRDQVIEVYEAHFKYLIDDLNQLIAEHPDLVTLAEIGAGGGSFTQMLTENVRGIENWIGNDLSMDIIAENRKLYPNIEWFAGDGKAWIETYGEPCSIFLTFRGVLEYFTQDNLDAMFAFIAEHHRPSAFVLVEPVALDHDLEAQTDSRAYGTEYSFSHNYPHLLTKNGYTIRRQKLVTFDDHHLCAVIATTGFDRPTNKHRHAQTSNPTKTVKRVPKHVSNATIKRRKAFS